MKKSREHFARYFSLPESVCVLHVAAGDGRQLCDHVHRLGRCWSVFLFIDWLLV